MIVLREQKLKIDKKNLMFLLPPEDSCHGEVTLQKHRLDFFYINILVKIASGEKKYGRGVKYIVASL